VYFVQIWVFNQSYTVTRKLVGVFVRFRAPMISMHHNFIEALSSANETLSSANGLGDDEVRV
jgi:hypothetical protein